MKKILLFALICGASKLFAQVKPAIVPADTIPAIINHTIDGNSVKFTPQLRDLRAIAGAPAPFYTYLWEFGDGTFSFEKDPLHLYADTGKFNVRLFATNNYDDGKRPPTRPKPIVVKSGKPMMAAAPVPGFFKLGGSVALKNNCMPKPGDDMILIMGYRNKTENLKANISGTIAILYNDKEFSNNNFDLAESRVYHNESKADLRGNGPLAMNSSAKAKQQTYYASAEPGLSSAQVEEILAKEALVIKDQLANFKSSQAWHFENLKSGSENFVFLHFKTTPEMIKDTNATVRLTGVFLPDDPSVDKELFNMELQIVASHDPNKMSIKKTRMNYRLTGKNRELTYKVRFQNNGKGPAKKIDVGVSLSPVFDPATISVSKTKPEVQVGDAGYANQSHLTTVTGTDSVHFIFNNIYLPGSQQEGVHDVDSTQGFVEYKIRFKEKPAKLPIYTGAAIVFDKNEPVYTNRAAGRFKMGLSPAIIAGFGFPFKSDNSQFITQKNITLGASIAPYSPYRQFLQAEVYLTDFQSATQTRSITANKDTVIGKDRYVISNRSQTTSTKVTTLNLVPVSLRYNFNAWVGGGVGALVSVDLNNTFKNNINYALTGVNGVANTNVEALASNIRNAFSDARASLFADVVVGRVRVGPSLGIRYFYDTKSNLSRTSTYVTWKF
ncbi:PKD domain-containing protein [Mucilaginibacter mali]|uniref:PKD domain-containing protein n=1 Tax=Mucilaginibacter mali TaxID=2740462 RepID=A0A7D4UPL5_9SPHI|nr:PKD domain-containing protein [Mucilaginibacter mali]QKJ30740.1 PKD domain-containing protein [Mucilaginibacter mali]